MSKFGKIILKRTKKEFGVLFCDQMFDLKADLKLIKKIGYDSVEQKQKDGKKFIRRRRKENLS
jgi:hypothetical protein